MSQNSYRRGSFSSSCLKGILPDRQNQTRPSADVIDAGSEIGAETQKSQSNLRPYIPMDNTTDKPADPHQHIAVCGSQPRAPQQPTTPDLRRRGFFSPRAPHPQVSRSLPRGQIFALARFSMVLGLESGPWRSTLRNNAEIKIASEGWETLPRPNNTRQQKRTPRWQRPAGHFGVAEDGRAGVTLARGQAREGASTERLATFAAPKCDPTAGSCRDDLRAGFWHRVDRSILNDLRSWRAPEVLDLIFSVDFAPRVRFCGSWASGSPTT